MDNMVFLNRGDHFEATPMPMEAQLAPAFSTCSLCPSGLNASRLASTQLQVIKQVRGSQGRFCSGVNVKLGEDVEDVRLRS